ncbi:MAG: c-type cytochrome biogenesis protein CcsB [Deltaproteobacteria bacterium]|nr:c-type cytochrome biogenesis protein CcsB [Deltaproteobacteria bacterium]
MNIVILKVSAFAYLAATAVHLYYLLFQEEFARNWARRATWAAFGLHTVGLGVRFVEAGYTPVASLHEAMSFFAWCIVGFYLALQLRYRLASLGAFVSPLALLFVLSAMAVPGQIEPLPAALQSSWLPVHVILLFVGDGAFALAAAAGIMYLLQEGQLKRKRLGAWFHRLPNLDVLDELNYRCLTIGFPLLTLGIITGAIWAQQAWGSYWTWDPKETWSLITWLLYAALLHGRLTIGWRGRRAAWWALIGFASVLFTFLGVNFVLPKIIPNLESLHIYAG